MCRSQPRGKEAAVVGRHRRPDTDTVEDRDDIDTDAVEDRSGLGHLTAHLRLPRFTLDSRPVTTPKLHLLRLLLSGGIALGASDFAYSYAFLRSVVCRLSVCRLSHSAPCLNRTTDLDACIWQVHLWGPMTHCVRWGSLKGRRYLGRYLGIEPKHAITNCFCDVANRNVELHGLATAIPPFIKLLWTSCYY